MKKVLVVLLSIFSSAFLHASENGPRNTPDRLMDLVSKSTLRKRGSSKWKNYIQRDSTQVEIVFAHTPQRTYTGKTAYSFHLAQQKRKQFDHIENAESGHFTICNHEGYVTITGETIDTAAENINADKIPYLDQHHELKRWDNLTTCEYVQDLLFNINEHNLEAILIGKYTMSMPRDLFVAALKAADSRAKKADSN